MIKSKITSQYKIVFGLLILVLLYSYIVIKNDLFKSNYSLNDNIIIGYIMNKKVDGNKIVYTVMGKEKININYYVNTIDELNYYSGFKLGDYIKAEGELYEPLPNTNFNLFNYKEHLKSLKINYLMKCQKISLVKNNDNIFYNIKNRILNKINNYNTSSYLKTFILGDTSGIESEVTDSFKDNGISHLFAISGMHITLLSTLILGLLNKFQKNNFNYLIVSLLLIFYAFLVNFSPSVLRSVMMFIFLYINKRYHWNIKTDNILILIAIILLLYNPYYIYNLGFKFSFIIRYFLIIFGYIINRQKNYFLKLITTSLIAFVVSIPIIINNFYVVNIITPVLNIIFVPIISVIIFPLLLISFVFQPLEIVVSFLINIFEWLSIILSNCKINIVFSHVPFYILIIYYIVILMMLYNFKKNIVFFILLISIHLISNNIGNYSIHMLDVGQGDAILLRMGNKSVLFDVGGNNTYVKESWMVSDHSIADNTIIPYLHSLGITSLDYLVITHGDYDHIGEAINIVKGIKVNNVLLNSGSNNDLENNFLEVLKNNRISYKNISNYTIKIDKNILHFINDKDVSNENEDSLIVYAKIKKRHILLMGDAGIDSENYIIMEYKLPKMDILKVGHHGSKNSTSLNFLDIIKPKCALISNGRNNRFNHPHKEVLDNLNKINTKYYNTSINGGIKIDLDSMKVDICM